MKSNVLKLGDEEGNVYWGKIIIFLLALILSAMVIVIATKYLSAGESWASLPAEKYNAKNLEKEYEWFYTMHNQIKANRQTIKNLKTHQEGLKNLQGADTSKWSSMVQDEYKQIAGQILQVETANNNACADYTARWQNVFHNMAAPSDIPKTCDLLQ